MNNDQTIELAEIFKLLGDPTRLRIVIACLDGEKNVGDIAATVAASPSLVSHHLRLLRAARLVVAERRGRSIYYGAADEHVRCTLRDMIEHVGEAHPEDT
ncbi:MAG: ArsR/SmtB family transcription factor [Alphaproteobacteria bacterium]